MGDEDRMYLVSFVWSLIASTCLSGQLLSWVPRLSLCQHLAGCAENQWAEAEARVSTARPHSLPIQKTPLRRAVPV